LQVRDATDDERPSSDRSRRIRDAVEAALSDIILLGTEEQVTLAARAAAELAAGRPAHTDELVISLRNFIRQVLDLDPVPSHVTIPKQGPARVVAARSAGKGGENKERAGSGEGKGMGGGAVTGLGLGIGGSMAAEQEPEHDQ